MIEKIVFLLMILTALYICFASNLKIIIIAMGFFSLLSAFVYLLYHAPDVAIAEAVIGSALSTILYIVALKKYHTFYVYITSLSDKEKNDFNVRLNVQKELSKITKYCVIEELQIQTVHTWHTPEQISNENIYDIILEQTQGGIVAYGNQDELHVKNVKDILGDSVKFINKAEGN